MELAQIEAFLVLCEELHFGRTAERLYVYQPRISRLIAALECEIGGTLFERTSRRVTLTPVGAGLRERLAPAYEQLNTALADARTAARSPAGVLRLGFAATTAGPALDQVIVAFERARPDCSVSLREVTLSDSFAPLRSGAIDVLVCWLVLDHPGLTIGPEIARYPRLLAVAADHPLARERSVSVEVLADHPVPNFDYQGLADRLRRAMIPARTPSGRAVQVHPTPVRTAGEVASLIARGLVVLPTATMQGLGNDGIVFLPIRDLPPVPLGLIWWTSHENARVRAFADVARTLAPLRRSWTRDTFGSLEGEGGGG
ncbi:LysR substrate-binding domain-containing protein [Spirillospora sp. CA-128828]|uniref:LysR substrate-binding domain-containing protein n=1 Tax=Spirillospora sp. CA-128828 TaxID=3240033 RepID=UPI003D8F7654